MCVGIWGLHGRPDLSCKDVPREQCSRFTGCVRARIPQLDAIEITIPLEKGTFGKFVCLPPRLAAAAAVGMHTASTLRKKIPFARQL